jgi:hypothetical protein
MMAFGAALPTIQERVERDLAQPALPQEKICDDRASDGDHPDSGRECGIRQTKPVIRVDYDAGQDKRAQILSVSDSDIAVSSIGRYQDGEDK